MTTKVVKGSLWTLLGQVLPMLVALVATPFTIRFLGSDGYGVLILIGLIPTYFAFADFGMGLASTKFASEAYGEGDPVKEGEVVRTAALIAFVTSMIFGVPIFVFSSWIVTQFNVPDAFHSAASIGLKITSISFVLGILSSVVNTPMLARLRMDLNTVSSAVPKVLMGVITPFVLYLGAGVVGAVWIGLFAALLSIAGILFFSGRLLPMLFNASLNIKYVRPLIKFGSGWILASIAGMLLVNIEKLTLTKMLSVQALSYYSVAFTFANIASTFTVAMIQSLVPAFSQLQGFEKKSEFELLFSRSIRLNLILVIPIVSFLMVIAEPFFEYWAGEEFGRESTIPFYIMILGLLCNILAYIPHTTISAKGRTDLFAKIYWIELPLYTVAAIMLIGNFGITGAAIAWSFRAVLDTFVTIWLAKSISNITFRFFDHFTKLFFATLPIIASIIYAIAFNNYSVWILVFFPISIVFYTSLIWYSFLENDEREWVKGRVWIWLAFAR